MAVHCVKAGNSFAGRATLCSFLGWLATVACAQDLLYHALPIAPPFGGILSAKMNDVGHVAGRTTGNGYLYYWSPSTGMVNISHAVPEGAGQVIGINNLGHVAIRSNGESYLWKGYGSATHIGHVSLKKSTQVYGLNDYDQLVGQAKMPARDSVTGTTTVAWLWEESIGFSILGDLPGGNYNSDSRAINNDGVVIGTSVGCGFAEVFTWTAAGGMKGTGICIGNPQDINEFGQYCGEASKGTTDAFMYDPATGLHYIPEPFGSFSCSYATEINDDGVVVGYGYPDCGNMTFETEYVFLWDQVSGFRLLKDVVKVDAATAPLWPFYWGAFINNRYQWLVRQTNVNGPVFRLDPFIPGDMNCDGVVDTDDLQPFLGQMLKYAGSTPPLFDGEECGWWIGDINQDARLDENDLAPFLALLK